MGASLGLVGASWGSLGASWGPLWQSAGVPGPSDAVGNRRGAVSGRTLGPRGAFRCRLGGHLGRFGSLLGRPGATPSWGHLGPSWGHLGGLLGRLGASESRKGENAKHFGKPNECTRIMIRALCFFPGAGRRHSQTTARRGHKCRSTVLTPPVSLSNFLCPTAVCGSSFRRSILLKVTSLSPASLFYAAPAPCSLVRGFAILLRVVPVRKGWRHGGCCRGRLGWAGHRRAGG